MIRVSVHLLSARTGQVTELARMDIFNLGTFGALRDYGSRVFIGRSKTQLDRGRVLRGAEIKAFPSQRLHIWNLVAAMLAANDYGPPRVPAPSATALTEGQLL